MNAEPKPLTPNDLLDDVTCKLERLRALYASNTADLGEVATSNASAHCVYDMWMIYVLAGEKLDEIDQIVARLDEAVRRPRAAA